MTLSPLAQRILTECLQVPQKHDQPWTRAMIRMAYIGEDDTSYVTQAVYELRHKGLVEFPHDDSGKRGMVLTVEGHLWPVTLLDVYRRALMHAGGMAWQEWGRLLPGADFDEDCGGENSWYLRWLRDALEDLPPGRNWAEQYMDGDLREAEAAVLREHTTKPALPEQGGETVG